MSGSFIHQNILEMVTLAGQIMLENGAETYRVEDTMQRMCKIDGIKSSDSFVTPTGMFISIETDDGMHYNTLKRVRARKTNLSKIYEVNNVSRELVKQNITVQEAILQLHDINNQPFPNKRWLAISSGASSFFFALLLGGSIWDGIITSFSSAIIRLIGIISANSDRLSYFLIDLLGGAIAAALAIFFAGILHIGSIYGITIGAITPLLPGLAITNGIRDMIHGDLVSGTARIMEALSVAIAIASGVGMVLQLWFIVRGGL